MSEEEMLFDEVKAIYVGKDFFFLRLLSTSAYLGYEIGTPPLEFEVMLDRFEEFFTSVVTIILIQSRLQKGGFDE